MEERLNISSYDDVFDLFIRDEEEAMDMYDRFARGSREPELKKMFEQIGRDEMGHLTTLKNMWKKYSDKEEFPSPIEVKISQEGKDNDNYEFNSYYEILEYAAESEKNSEKLYLDIANQVKDEEAKQLFLKNGKEEEKHRHRIEKMMEMYF